MFFRQPLPQEEPPLQKVEAGRRRRVLDPKNREQGMPNLPGKAAGAEQMVSRLLFLVAQPARCIARQPTMASPVRGPDALSDCQLHKEFHLLWRPSFPNRLCSLKVDGALEKR